VYTRVSNSEARKEQMAMVLTAVKASVAATALSTTALLLIPDAVYQWLFGAAITGITPILLVMAPGLLAMAASQPLSHFLSGTGGVMQNAWSSGIGAVITLAVGVLAIPVWGLLGAALTSSCAHLVSVLYQWYVFQRATGAEWRALLPASGDRQALGTLWRRVLGR
jgi:O-antigen/teichoic acid export membrane protein